MSQTVFNDLQDLFVYALGPFIAWGMVALAAGGFAAGVAVIWLEFLKFLTRR